MRRLALSALLTLTALTAALAACAGPATTTGQPPLGVEPATASPQPGAAEAATPAAPLPVRGDGPPLPGPDAVLTRVAFGAGADPTANLPVFAAVAAARPDLFILLGDAVGGGVHAGQAEDPPPSRLHAGYADLNLNAQFAAFNMSTPLLAVWNEGDYGAGGGADFPHKAAAETAFETYWGSAALGGDHPGVYGARSFGPPGRRVQVLLLDARFFRSPPGEAAGLLGGDQWRWLKAELRKPADVRLLASPLPVLADRPGAETWAGWPAERRRLLEAVRQAEGAVVLLSGGAAAGLSPQGPGFRPSPVQELTSGTLSGMARERGAPDVGSVPAGAGLRTASFGRLDIDWARRRVRFSVQGVDGAAVGIRTISFGELGA